MNHREYLVKAQEAEALADATSDAVERLVWETRAKEYRRLAKVAVELPWGRFL